MKIKKNNNFLGVLGRGGGRVGLGGVRVDVNKESKFFVKIKKTHIFFLGGVGLGEGGSGEGGQVGGG